MKTEITLNKASFGNSLNPIIAFYTYRAGEAKGPPKKEDFILLVNKKNFDKLGVPGSIVVTVKWDEVQTV